MILGLRIVKAFPCFRKQNLNRVVIVYLANLANDESRKYDEWHYLVQRCNGSYIYALLCFISMDNNNFFSTKITTVFQFGN